MSELIQAILNGNERMNLRDFASMLYQSPVIRDRKNKVTHSNIAHALAKSKSILFG